MTNMRGTLLVNLAATLVMLASVLVGGGYWLINKQEQSREILQLPEKTVKKPLTFEQVHKRTE